jgi:hypothetical protein
LSASTTQEACGFQFGSNSRIRGSKADVRADTNGELSTLKSGKVRSVPMAHEVAEALARHAQREP